MNIVFLVIIGAAAGFIATRMMRIETGIAATILIGIVGALVGGLVLNALLAMLGALSGLIGAILGALVVIWLWQTYGPKDR